MRVHVVPPSVERSTLAVFGEGAGGPTAIQGDPLPRTSQMAMPKPGAGVTLVQLMPSLDRVICPLSPAAMNRLPSQLTLLRPTMTLESRAVHETPLSVDVASLPPPPTRTQVPEGLPAT